MERCIKYKSFFVCNIVLYSIFVLCGSCTHKTYFDEKEKVKVTIYRFDNELYHLTQSQNVDKDVRELYKKYDLFMPYFVENIIGIPASDTNYFCKQLKLFLNDTVYGFRETNKKVYETFKNIQSVEDELNNAFTSVHSVFPNMLIPDIYFYISGFNSSISFIGNSIGVGCDMYLGSDYPYYNKVVHNYQKNGMRPDCISVDVVSAFLFKNIPFDSKKNRLLENIIYRGKIMFVLTQLFPKRTEYDIMGYTKKQMDWCKRYEADVWNFIVDKKDLFQTHNLHISGYINDGPFTSEISQDCPARIGTWIGLQIVKQYMKNNDVSISDLINNWDAESMLYKSKYRP